MTHKALKDPKLAHSIAALSRGYLGGGPLERPLSGDEWFVPSNIQLSPDQRNMWWSYAPLSAFTTGKRSTLKVGLLERFVSLAKGTPEDVLRYAKEYGVLYLCQHDLPSSHQEIDEPSEKQLRDGGWFGRCRLHMTRDQRFYSESIDVWKRYASLARAALNVAAKMQYQQEARGEDWELLCSQVGNELPAGTWLWVDDNEYVRLPADYIILPKDDLERRQILSSAVDWWIGHSRIQPQFYLTESGPSVQFGNRTLFGAIASQLMMVAGKTEGLAICSNCGIPYVPSRKPVQGKRNYCLGCRPTAGPRNASRDYRDRQKKAT